MGIKVAISNMAWNQKDNQSIYEFMKELDYHGLEILPQKTFGPNPYSDMAKLKEFANQMKRDYNINIASMQSILCGRKENIFGSEEERNALIEHIQLVIQAALNLNCNNIVFGCPNNRIITQGSDPQIGVDFFSELAYYAAESGVVISVEPITKEYGTNYLNTIKDALDLVKTIDSKHLRLNYDLGTWITTQESPAIVEEALKYTGHVHISEPGLELLDYRPQLMEILKSLHNMKYDRYVSVEMAEREDSGDCIDTMFYLYDSLDLLECQCEDKSDIA